MESHNQSDGTVDPVCLRVRQLRFEPQVKRYTHNTGIIPSVKKIVLCVILVYKEWLLLGVAGRVQRVQVGHVRAEVAGELVQQLLVHLLQLVALCTTTYTNQNHTYLHELTLFNHMGRESRNSFVRH